jgi:hypothetical protein
MAFKRKPKPAKSAIFKNYDTLKMHDENLHIVPDPKKGFPQPEIPTDEAWNKMAGLLDTEMPVSPPHQSLPPQPPSKSAGGIIRGGSNHFWGIILSVVAVVAVITWGIIYMADKPESSIVIKSDTVKPVQSNTVIAPSTLADQKQVISADQLKAPERLDNQDINKIPPLPKSVPDKSVQQVVTSEKGIISQPKAEPKEGIFAEPISQAKFEKEPSVAPAIPVQVQVKPPTFEPTKPDSGNITNDVKEIAVREPISLTTSKDTAQSAKSQSAYFFQDTTFTRTSVNPVTNDTALSIPAVKVNPDKNVKPAGTVKSEKSSGMSENLIWQLGVTGNIGQVYQKGRDANNFYGAMVTTGLWNKKLNGGIETGLGWEDYKDYGSVTEHIQITDSIPIDTLGNFHYTDFYRTTKYKYNYQYLQIPLFISKQLFAAGKFSLDLKTGPLVGIMISERKTIDYASGPDGGEILSTVYNDYTRLNISWQWQLMAQFRWNFNDRLSLTLSPYGIFYLNNLYDSKKRPANMPFGIGAYGGLIYRFK